MFAESLPMLGSALGAVLSDVLRACVVVAALLAPGYVWGRALFGPRPIPDVDRIVFALGLSLTSYVIGAFALNWTPWGLQRATWATWLVLLLVGGILVILSRGDFPKAFAAAVRTVRETLRGSIVQIVVAITLVALAYAVSYVGALRQPREGFTQAWILAIEGSAIPTARLGLSNHEGAPRRYRAEVSWSGTLLHRFDDVLLRPGEAWTEDIILAEGPPTGKLELAVFLDAEAGVHRRVTLVFGGEGGGGPDASGGHLTAFPLR